MAIFIDTLRATLHGNFPELGELGPRRVGEWPQGDVLVPGLPFCQMSPGKSLEYFEIRALSNFSINRWRYFMRFQLIPSIDRVASSQLIRILIARHLSSLSF